MKTMQDKGWNAMKNLLDEQMPVQKKPLWRRLSPLVLFLLALSVSGVLYLNHQQQFTGDMLSAFKAPQYGNDSDNQIFEVENIEKHIPNAISSLASEFTETSSSLPLTPDVNPLMLTETNSTPIQTEQSNNGRIVTERKNQPTRDVKKINDHITDLNEYKTHPETQTNIVDDQVIALRPADVIVSDYEHSSTSLAMLATLQAEYLPVLAELSAPMAPDILPLAQNIFQLRAHGNFIALPGHGVNGGSAGLSARLALSKKAGLLAGASLGYIRPYSPLREEAGVFNQLGTQEEQDGVIFPDNYHRIRHYWHAHYSASAAYKPWTPLELQLGMFHITRLNRPETNRVFTTDNTTSEPLDNQENWRDFHDSFTGLQTGLSIQITPRWSVDGRYMLGFKKWLTPSSDLGKGPHMQLFKAGIAYRFL